MIGTFATQKGGAGKTALTIHIGSELYARGRDVLLADHDPQGSTLNWHGRGARQGADIPSAIGVGAGILHALPPVAARHQWVLVDTTGKHTETLGHLLSITDVVLLPTPPRLGDIESLAETLDLVREAQDARPELRAAIVITQARRTRLARAAVDALAATATPVLETQLLYYDDYEIADRAGRGVTQARPKGRAAGQLSDLVDEIEARFGGKRRRKTRG